LVFSDLVAGGLRAALRAVLVAAIDGVIVQRFDSAMMSSIAK